LSVYGSIPDGFKSEWRPLGEPSAKEKALTFKNMVASLALLLDKGVILEAHIAAWLQTQNILEIDDDYIAALKEVSGATPETEQDLPEDK
jgi:predicted RecB family nuclease